MKGIIFNVFNKLVEEKFGLETWDALIEETQPASRGAYTSAGTYADQELFAMVGVLSKKTGAPATDLVRIFGEYTLHELAKAYPVFFKHDSLKSFLQSIHGVIHVEVRKLYPDAGLPEITYEDPGPDQLVMIYRSPRKLCALAEGLTQGAAAHFKEKVSVQQTKCLHNGETECRLELRFTK